MDAPETPWRDEWQARADAWIGLIHNDPMYECINKPAFLQLVPFPGAHRPIDHYSRALEDARLVIEAIREPQPDADALARFPYLSDWARVPDFLHFRAAKVT